MLLQLPELILGEVVDKLPIADQECLRLVCKSWRDQLPAQNLGRTVKLLSARDLESRAGRLKSRYPNVVLQVDKISCFNHWDQDQHAFLASPLCDVLRLKGCKWTSTVPQSDGDADIERHIAKHQAQQKHLRSYHDLMNSPGALPKLQLDMEVEFFCSIGDAEKQGIVNELGPITLSLSLAGDLSLFVAQIHLNNLTKLKYKLPLSSSNAEAETLAQQSKAALLSLHQLRHLAIAAGRDVVQAASVLQVLPQLPNLSTLQVTTGIIPYCIQSSLLLHVTRLMLGHSVTVDEAPPSLRSLHLDLLSQSSKPMMLQLEQHSLLYCITVGFLVPASQPLFDTEPLGTGISGLLTLPVNLLGLELRQQLDRGCDDILDNNFSYVQGLGRLEQLQFLFLHEPLTESVVKLLSMCEFPRLHRFGFWLAERTPFDDLNSHGEDRSERPVLMSLPVQFADLSAATFPAVEVMEVLGVQFALASPSQRTQRVGHHVVCLDSWWMTAFPHLRRIWNRSSNTSLQLCCLPLDCNVVVL